MCECESSEYDQLDETSSLQHFELTSLRHLDSTNSMSHVNVTNSKSHELDEHMAGPRMVGVDEPVYVIYTSATATQTSVPHTSATHTATHPSATATATPPSTVTWLGGPLGRRGNEGCGRGGGDEEGEGGGGIELGGGGEENGRGIDDAVENSSLTDARRRSLSICYYVSLCERVCVRKCV